VSSNIVLTGFMGTGKSTIGKNIAARLGRKFIDTDTLVEQKSGKTIAALFMERGEPYFRTLEREAIDQVCAEEGLVVATGGGALVNEENVRKLKANGTVICLTATPEIILSRVQGNTDRPLLQSDDPLGKIRTLLAARADAYAKADLTIDTSCLSVEAVVEKICSRLLTSLRT
jgi:shikimate kinase